MQTNSICYNVLLIAFLLLVGMQLLIPLFSSTGSTISIVSTPLQHAFSRLTSLNTSSAYTLPMKYLYDYMHANRFNHTTNSSSTTFNSTSTYELLCTHLLLQANSHKNINITELEYDFNTSIPHHLIHNNISLHLLHELLCTRSLAKEKTQTHPSSKVDEGVSSSSSSFSTSHLSSTACEYNFKVYVYPISESLSSLRISEEARHNKTLHVCRKCIMEQFSLEYIIFDFLTQFCGRTMDPYEADYFYLPMVRDAELRWLMESGKARHRPPFPAEKAHLDLLERNDSRVFTSYFSVSDEWWHRNQGADHIIVMPAPVTNLRHERNARGFFHYMLQLHSPIFVAIEYSKSFIDEYPICSRLKNILVPYPTVDPELYSRRWKVPAMKTNRSALLFYSGGLHGDCMEVRQGLHQLVKNSSKLEGVLPSMNMKMDKRETGFTASTFCPIPVGDSPSSKRMYDVMNFGCIPVILSDDLVWAYSNESGGPLDHTTFSIQLPQSVVHLPVDQLMNKFSREQFGRLPRSGLYLRDLLSASLGHEHDYENGKYVSPLVRILRRVPYEDVLHLRQGVRKAAPSYRFYKMGTMNRIPIAHHKLPDGDAIKLFAQELEYKKQRGLVGIRDQCRAERKRPGHKYVSRYPCDNTKKKGKSSRTS